MSIVVVGVVRTLSVLNTGISVVISAVLILHVSEVVKALAEIALAVLVGAASEVIVYIKIVLVWSVEAVK